MKGKNLVVSLFVVAIILPYAELLLVNLHRSSARNFEVEIERIISSDNKEETCPSKGGSIPCPT